MKKCPKCNVDSALYRAIVEVCPNCGRMLDAEELFRLLGELGVPKDAIESVKRQLLVRKKTVTQSENPGSDNANLTIQEKELIKIRNLLEMQVLTSLPQRSEYAARVNDSIERAEREQS